MAFVLRPYQATASRVFCEHMDGGRHPLISLPTGAGKTAPLADIGKTRCERTRKRTLYLVHRGELADQIIRWIHRLDPSVGEPFADENGYLKAPGIGREQAESRADTRANRPPYVVAMVQTLGTKTGEARLKSFDPNEFDTVLADEGHLSHAKGWQDIFKHFRQNKRCRQGGVSATWADDRGEGIGRACGFDSVAVNLKVLDMVRAGWLCGVRSLPLRVTGIEWDKVAVDALGHFDKKALDEALSQAAPFHQLTLAVRDLAGDRPTLVYGPGKRWVKRAWEAFEAYEPGNVRWVTDDLKDQVERGAAFADFRAGLYRKLVNCNVVTVGIDLPNAAVAAVCRPAQSIVLISQIIGRVMRPLDGLLDDPARRDELWSDDPGPRLAAIAGSAKPWACALDFVAAGARKVLTSVDVLGGDYAPGVREYANKLLAGDPPPGRDPADVLDVLGRAEAEVALLREEVERRRKLRAVAVQYEVGPDLDLFDPRGAAPAATHTPAQLELATPAQVDTIVGKLGWDRDRVRQMTKKDASGVIAGIRAGRIKPKQQAG